MFANASLISCNFSTTSPSSSLRSKTPKLRSPLHLHHQPQNLKPTTLLPKTNSGFSTLSRIHNDKVSIFLPLIQQKGRLQICHSTLNSPNPEDPVLSDGDSLETEGGKNGNVGDWSDWMTSILLFVLWGALLYYAFNLAPNQTPGHVFLKNALEFEGGRWFQNESSACGAVVHNASVAIGVQQAAASDSSKSKVAVWPFALFSFFGGIYALLPYFVLWKPSPPSVEESELSRWPLNFLESKFTAGSMSLALISLDYQHMTARKWFDKGSLLLPLSLVPFVGPALYILLRPPLSTLSASWSSTTSEPK